MMKIPGWTRKQFCGRPTVALAALVASAVTLSACASRGQPPPNPAETLRPRIAQVVDADTGQPVQGAIVLIVFYLWPERGFGNFPRSKVFRDSREAFTDKEGRFELNGPFDSRSYGTERVHIFKPGYGPWRFQGQDNAPSPTRAWREYGAWMQQAWERFTTTGMVIELKPLRTREERLKYAEYTWDLKDQVRADYGPTTLFGPPYYFFDVPNDRLTNFQTLVDQERANLGLPPRPLNGNRQPR